MLNSISQYIGRHRASYDEIKNKATLITVSVEVKPSGNGSYPMILHGYVATPDPWPDNLHRAGSGITPAGALRSLYKQAASDGIDLIVEEVCVI